LRIRVFSYLQILELGRQVAGFTSGEEFMAEEVVRDVPRYPVRPITEFTEFFNRLSWSAVWAGVMIALGMEILFTFFGFSIGFAMYKWQAANPWAGISAWTTIWYFVTIGWSMFFGAWCAARLSGNPVRESGMLHGITVWGLATLASIMVVALGAWSVMREGINVLSTAALATASVAPGTSQQAGAALSQMQANAGPMAQATAHSISRLALGIWIGVLIGFITALFGGIAGRPTAAVVPARETPGPTRLAA
jgi:hypothetical protein